MLLFTCHFEHRGQYQKNNEGQAVNPPERRNGYVVH